MSIYVLFKQLLNDFKGIKGGFIVNFIVDMFFWIPYPSFPFRHF